MHSYIALLYLMVSSVINAELIDVISTSPDKQYQIAIIYPSQEAKQRDKKITPSKANFGSRPVVLIDTKNKKRVKIGGDGIAGNIDIQWIKGTNCVGYYEREEASWTHELYRIVRKPELKLLPIKLPSIEALVIKFGEKPDNYYDKKYEFLSQEFIDYSRKGEVKVSLLTRSNVGRCGATRTLSYDVIYKTKDYSSFEPVRVEKRRQVKGEEPIASLISLNKK